MGSDPAAEHAPDPDEAPRCYVSCPAFRIGRTPVTNGEYRVFVEASGHPAPTHWPDGAIPAGRELHPVTYVSWSDALAFCRWAGGLLPSEAQWERAARGDDDRTWPWGDEPPMEDRATFEAADTSPVALHPRGASPFGALDTDFTAKLVDVHPVNEDYPEGYDMLLNDSVIRCRYREGFDREVLLDPGVPVPVTITLPPTSNLFDAGHRIRVDVSSSNWPRLDVNPNTGEPVCLHTHQVVAAQAVYGDAERPSHILLPVIPR